jgi:Pyridoxamine 5'-phosphate oxidase
MPQSTYDRAAELHEVMNPELRHALNRHTQWFGSYKKSGELKKIHVWLSVHQGQIEFLTPGDSYKVKRVRRNPRVICYVGARNGPAIPGTAQVITSRAELMRVYRAYWKIHPIGMAIMIGLRVWIGILLHQRVVVRVLPDDPNPLAGVTDPAS